MSVSIIGPGPNKDLDNLFSRIIRTVQQSRKARNKQIGFSGKKYRTAGRPSRPPFGASECFRCSGVRLFLDHVLQGAERSDLHLVVGRLRGAVLQFTGEGIADVFLRGASGNLFLLDLQQARHGEYAGTLSEGDLLWAMLNHEAYDNHAREALYVRDILKGRQNKPVNVNAAIDDLLLMAMNQNFIPVTDDRGLFIGIVTRRDILQYYYDKTHAG